MSPHPVSTSVAARTESHNNAFDALRLFAASLVLLSHCYPLTGHREPFLDRTGISLGDVGVLMFFAMSGFLVTRSWTSQPEPGAYALKRALRLFPALIVVVVLTALVLGPLVTTLPVGRYLAAPGTYLYVVKCSLLWTFQNQLPGVFAGNVYPAAVNGSLWTLPVEALAYAVVAGVGLTVGLRRAWPALAAIIGGALLLTPLVDIGSHATSAVGGSLGGELPSVIQLYVAFAVGMLLWIERDRATLRWRYIVPLLGVWVGSWSSQWVTVTSALIVP